MTTRQSLPERLRPLFDRLVRKDLSVALMGHGAEKLLGAIVTAAVLGALSTSDYGSYESAITVMLISAKIFDLGLDTSLLRALSRAHHDKNAQLEKSLLRAAFGVKVGLSLLVFVVGWWVAPWLADIMDHPHVTNFLRVAFLGVLGKQLTGLYKAMFAGRLAFDHMAIFVACGPALTVLVFPLLWLYSRSLGPEQCLAAVVGGPLLASCIATLYYWHLLRESHGKGLRALDDVFDFGRWIYAAEVLGLVRAKIGTLVLYSVASSYAAGVYGAADRLASLVTVFSLALTTVLIPKASRLTNLDEMRTFLKGTRRYIPFILLSIPLAPLLSRLLKPLILAFRPDFAESAPLFGILLASMVLSIAAYPAYSLLYALRKPQIQLAIETALLPLTLGLFMLLVEDHGSSGIAWAMVIQRAISSTLYIGYVEWRLRPGAPPLESAPAAS